MKTIGMIGGMSWESSAQYYRIINEEINDRLGGLHSAKCLLYSIDFEEIEKYQASGDWEKAGKVLGETAGKLEEAGADFIIICTNTMHKVISHIENKINIPILHIADATAHQIKQHDFHKIGLLGTKYTMEQDFYKERINSRGIDVLIPDQEERDLINQIIFEELCFGHIQSSSKEYMQKVMRRLAKRGAEGIILGCTEIGLLIKQEDAAIPLFDTTMIHAFEAVDRAL